MSSQIPMAPPSPQPANAGPVGGRDHPVEKPEMVVGEICRVAYETFCANKVRFVLTAVGMVIGTASLILVVTIGLAGKQYILNQIEAIGANMIYVYYEGGNFSGAKDNGNDFLTVEDMNAVRQEVPGVVHASPMVELHDRISIGSGQERDILMLGVSPEYHWIRNLEVLSGRFFDDEDTTSRNKVVVITLQLARQMFGGPDQAIGQTISLSGLPFTVIGTFRERVETFDLTEIAQYTLLIPYTVAHFYTGTDVVKQLFFAVTDASDVPRASAQIGEVLKSRHRSQSIYHVENLTAVLTMAAKVANAVTVVLLLVAAVTLLVSGVGIMNIMLATVGARIREIGIRKAIGATKREIRMQFLSESVFISLSGGVVGIIIGLAIPFSVRLLTTFRPPISGLSAVIAIVVSSLVGIIFGTVPAARAANLDPVESLRHE